MNLISVFVELLIINACYSNAMSRKIVTHVKCVIGCEKSIDDKAAIVFTQSFYRTLAHGSTYRAAFDWAKNQVSMEVSRVEADKFKILEK
jgi:hypothetical protein